MALGLIVVLASGFGRGAPVVKPSPSSAAAVVGSPTAPPTLSEAPVIQGPDTVYTSGKTWTGRVTLSPTQVPLSELTLRVMRDGTEVSDIDITRSRAMSVPDVQLKMGTNAITVAYVWNDTQGPPSNTVTVTRDASAPTVDVAAPLDGAITSAGAVTVAGHAEGGVTVRIRNTTLGTVENASPEADGTFSVSVALMTGDNKLTVVATDGAGNATSVLRTVTRDPGASELVLQLSRAKLRLENLPVTLNVAAVLTNAMGPAADGSVVTFSLSPPGVPSSTYQTTLQSQRAVWSGAIVPAGAETGGGFVTARVVLPGGKAVQAIQLFDVQ